TVSMLSIVSNNTRGKKINNVLESLEYYRSNPEITFRLVGDYYPFMVKDHVLNILTDPLRNYTLVELCIQNVGTQKWCSSTCYHDERSGVCNRFLTKGVYLESNQFPTSINVVHVPEIN
ncbi:Uncharacterized protein FWK35_00035560, partial [Aphis craccivora]